MHATDRGRCRRSRRMAAGGLRRQPVRRSDTGGASDAMSIMTGRWMLGGAERAVLRHEFRRRARRAAKARVEPEGGCPGKFFTSRRWTLDQGTLMINDDDNQPLAQLEFRQRPLRRPSHRRHAGDAGPPAHPQIRNANDRLSALLLRPVRQRLPRRADAQSDRRQVGAGLDRLLRRRGPAHARIPRGRQRDGRSAGAGARQQEAHPVGRDPHLSREPLPASSSRRARTRSWNRCAGSFSTIRRSTASSGRSAF